MFKKFAVIIAVLVLFASVNAFAQSFDVVVHNVQSGSPDNVYLEGNLNGQGMVPLGSQPAPSGSGYTTVTFNDIYTSSSCVYTQLKATQGTRTKTITGNFAPFSTYHIYLPGDIPWDDTIPENH
ncbi:MAG: hypothetical protein U9P79_08955 [Candidatus Cloacimonadota bacterium]|nr:hypothetical protein [Candidatus Cloacimonadota bacterium]